VRKFSWYTSWVGLLIFVGLLPALIVAMILTKRMTVAVPFCHRHARHWSSRNLITVLGFLACVGMFVLGIVLYDPKGQTGDVVLVGSLILFVAWLIALVAVSQTSIRPTKITDNAITLVNVN